MMVTMVPHEAFACRTFNTSKLFFRTFNASKLFFRTFNPYNYSLGSSRNAECSNCKHLRGKISVLKATMDMHMHPEQHTVNSAALFHEVLNEIEKLDLEYLATLPRRQMSPGKIPSLVLLFLAVQPQGALKTSITVVNDCDFTVWPGIKGIPDLNISGFELTKGDCGSDELECNERSPTPPVTLATFGLEWGRTYYGVNPTGGYNLQMTMEATSGDVIFCPSTNAFSMIKFDRQLNLLDQLVSVSGTITLGFFDYSRYLGIWYTNDAEFQRVWVANPNKPVTDNTTKHALSIDPNTGNLIIIDGDVTLMNITSIDVGPNPNVTATLEDDGNFWLINETSKRVLWQSFDHPTNILLPGMKLGSDIVRQ
ncbi:G-type lectin S-receptor-like serine/threonine-protein kinase [Tanacetum coccineum]